MKPYFEDKYVTILHGDCRKVLPEVSGITAVVTDPPYGLSFMGKAWDHGVPGPEFWAKISDSCLPGAPLLAFGGTRTYHRLICAIEDSGWEIRDCLMWLYGSGFPKSHPISKAIDKAAGVSPIDMGASPNWRESKRDREKDGKLEVRGKNAGRVTTPATQSARLWLGYGTALKPAFEPICLSMKSLDGTYAANALEYGIGGINIDGSRVSTNDVQEIGKPSWGGPMKQLSGAPGQKGKLVPRTPPSNKGRWPTNIIHDGSQSVLNLFPDSKGAQGSVKGTEPSHTGDENAHCYGKYGRVPSEKRGDSGSAARFFYCAKASKSERGEGNDHPTVKPLALMRHLLTLVTMPERNLILDPFCGSGSTGVACKELGLSCILIDEDEHACEIAAARMSAIRTTQAVLPL